MSESNISTTMPQNTKAAPVCAVPKPAANPTAPAPATAVNTPQSVSPKFSRRQVRKQH